MANVNPEDMEGYDELTAKFLASLPVELRLKGLAPKDRLKGLAPEDRFEGLTPKDRLKGLAPEDRFEGLATDELRAMLEELRRRLNEPE